MDVLRTLSPWKRTNKYRTLECGIYDVKVTDGIATIENFIIQTQSMTIIAQGKVNLQNERLDIQFRSKLREGIGISIGGVANQFLQLGGTLAAPSISLDPVSSVTTTGAAVATGGLSLLARGLWDRLSAEADICNIHAE